MVIEPEPVPGDTRTKAGCRAQTELAAGYALGRPVELRYRPDGKPEVGGTEVSASHCTGLTMVVAGPGRLGCDVETSLGRSEQDWAGLLGTDQLAVRDLLATEAGEDASMAATRVWGALECLRKTGATTQALTVERVDPDGWVVLSAGTARIATWPTTVTGCPDPVVFAVLEGKEV